MSKNVLSDGPDHAEEPLEFRLDVVAEMSVDDEVGTAPGGL